MSEPAFITINGHQLTATQADVIRIALEIYLEEGTPWPSPYREVLAIMADLPKPAKEAT